MKTHPFHAAALLGALAFLAGSATAQITSSGVYRATIPNGISLSFELERNSEIEVKVVDSTLHRSNEADGRVTNGAFSLNLASGGIVVAGTVAADGASITGTYTAGATVQNYVATKVVAVNANTSSPAAGIYDGTATAAGVAAGTVAFTIDPAGNLTFLQRTGSGATQVVSGGFGAITQTLANPLTYSFSATPAAAGAPITGTFTLVGGKLDGTFTTSAGTFAFTAFKTRLAHRLVNISTRGFVSTGAGALIGGFVIQGGAKQVLIVARGPSLAALGVSPALATTKIQLFAGPTSIATNTGWKTNSNLPAMLNLSFTATLQDAESALLVTLQPGAYTSIVTGADAAATGIALVEVYEISWE